MGHCSNVEDFSFIWEIKKFSEAAIRDSSTFVVDVLEDTKWKMIMCSGLCVKNSNRCICVTIINESNNLNLIRFELTLSVLTPKVFPIVSRKLSIKGIGKQFILGFDKFMSREEVLAKKDVYLPQDTLTILLYIVRKRELPGLSISREDDSHPQRESGIKSLNNDLQLLYLNCKFSDIQIETPDRTFLVHKTVLCARSPVFSAMFENDTKEKESGIVKITDVESETVNLMLTFFYSDSIGNLNRDQAAKLYTTADKYEVMPLLKECSSVLKKCLSDANFCETYTLADMHQDVDLKAAVEEYVFIHANRIFKSSDWEAYMTSNLKLSAELMHKLWKKRIGG